MGREWVLAKLIALGAESRLVVRQVDTYYAHPVRDFATTDEALRMRDSRVVLATRNVDKIAELSRIIDGAGLDVELAASPELQVLLGWENQTMAPNLLTGGRALERQALLPLADGRLADRRQQLARGALLQHVAGSAGLEQLLDVDEYIQIMSSRAAHQTHHFRALFPFRNVANE